MRKCDNALERLDKEMLREQEHQEKAQQEIESLEALLDKTAEYPKLTYLQALKEDHQELLKEIAKCSADRNYKSGFVAKSEQFASKAMQQDTQDNTIQDNTPEKSEKEDTLASKEKLETRMQQEAAQHPSASRANRADNTIQENYLEEIKTMNAFC
ncbi:hypothetical protein SNTW_10920 [Helicobacter suis]|uniref:Uncharacterized protein n=1 Tax=Helicobacter suis TaxID=104628 RepID=A0A6J4CY44_9HELI|nr:hypothetical protein SNTW_10920 [Helicobacter suis]